MSTYESGKYEPSIGMIKEFADYFNVSVDYLMGRSDERKPDWLKKQNKTEQKEYIKIINQAQKKGLKPSDIEEIIKIFEQIKPIIDNLSKNE